MNGFGGMQDAENVWASRDRVPYHRRREKYKYLQIQKRSSAKKRRDMNHSKYFERPVRGLCIRNGWYDIVETDDPASLIGAEEIEIPALKVGSGRYYGCICDANARESGACRDEYVVMHIKKRLRKHRFFGYVMGPVFVYLNRGLSDEDIAYLRKHIVPDQREVPHLIVEDFQDMAYERSDP